MRKLFKGGNYMRKYGICPILDRITQPFYRFQQKLAYLDWSARYQTISLCFYHKLEINNLSVFANVNSYFGLFTTHSFTTFTFYHKSKKYSVLQLQQQFDFSCCLIQMSIQTFWILKPPWSNFYPEIAFEDHVHCCK